MTNLDMNTKKYVSSEAIHSEKERVDYKIRYLVSSLLLLLLFPFDVNKLSFNRCFHL